MAKMWAAAPNTMYCGTIHKKLIISCTLSFVGQANIPHDTEPVRLDEHYDHHGHMMERNPHADALQYI